MLYDALGRFKLHVWHIHFRRHLLFLALPLFIIAGSSDASWTQESEDLHADIILVIGAGREAARKASVKHAQVIIS